MTIFKPSLIIVPLISLLCSCSSTAQTTVKNNPNAPDLTIKSNAEKDSIRTAGNSVTDIKKLRTLYFISGKIYFSGNGFATVKMIDAADAELLNRFLDISKTGTAITLDNCTYKNEHDQIESINKSFVLL